MEWMRLKRAGLGGVLALALVACGDETSGGNDAGVTPPDGGTVDAGGLGGELAFPVRFAGTLERRLSDGGVNPDEVVVLLADDPNLGATLCQGRPYPGGEVRSLEFGLKRAPGGTFVGSYSVDGPLEASYREFTGRSDGSFTDKVRLSAETGSVSVTGARERGVEGTMDLRFPAPSGGPGTVTLTGPFVAPYCGTL